MILKLGLEGVPNAQGFFLFPLIDPMVISSPRKHVKRFH